MQATGETNFMKRNYRSLLVNSDGVPLLVCNWTKAITLVFKKKVSMVDFYPDDFIRDGHNNHYSIPAVVILNKYIHRDYQKAPFSKAAVFARDLYQCAYCLNTFKSPQLTLDHVIPKSKWNGSGTSTCWTNIVTACWHCNSRKADKTCREADMFPANMPRQPNYDEVFFGLHFHGKIEPEWIKWLMCFDSFKKIYAKDEALIGTTQVY